MFARDAIPIGVAMLLALAMRLVGADAPTALPDSGLGILRYGDDRSGPHALTARFDDFRISSDQASDYGNQDGHAVTLAYRFEPNAHRRFTLEGVRTRGLRVNRQIIAGGAPFATESLVQLAIRYGLSNY